MAAYAHGGRDRSARLTYKPLPHIEDLCHTCNPNTSQICWDKGLMASIVLVAGDKEDHRAGGIQPLPPHFSSSPAICSRRRWCSLVMMLVARMPKLKSPMAIEPLLMRVGKNSIGWKHRAYPVLLDSTTVMEDYGSLESRKTIATGAGDVSSVTAISINPRFRCRDPHGGRNGD